MAAANFELADLTGKVGRKEEALTGHRSVLAARESLALEPGGRPGQVEVGAACWRWRASWKRLARRARRWRSTTGRRPSWPAWRAATPRRWRPCGVPVPDRSSPVHYRRERPCARGLPTGPLGAGGPGRRARRLDEVRRDLAATINNIGILLHNTGKLAEAGAEYRQALAIRQKLADDNPAVTEFRSLEASSHNNLGYLLSNTGRPMEAETENRKALEIRQKLVDDNPAVTEFRIRLAVSHNNLGNLLWETGRPIVAVAEHRRALEIRQKLADDNPAVTEFKSDLAQSHNNLGWMLSNTGQPAAAEAEYRKALAIWQTLADDNPAVTELRHALANSYNNLGHLLADTGRPADAEDQFREKIEVIQEANHLSAFHSHRVIDEFQKVGAQDLARMESMG